MITVKTTSGSPEQPNANWAKAFTVTAYQPYVHIDTSDILERMKESLFSFIGNFNEKTANSPDLYGPFWICTTLIFVSASIGTSIAYLADKFRHKEWEYDIHLLTSSACILYGYALLCLYGKLLFCIHSSGASVYHSGGNVSIGVCEYCSFHVSNVCRIKSKKPRPFQQVKGGFGVLPCCSWLSPWYLRSIC
ncbi:hypothetical protein M8C21_000882 [Ambrosia artemisiifolia]|uniref:Protein YIP n=1 Tax=Ambrosia artemisiifolia TaxID=4212 RepID=A0AAD5CGD9_AMBAR|nr:hypothetical protein M8C21_000882 [Ambrosia artemisiifolia]